jgi:TRAP-type C4-dicarboxylate transport system permease small subunit
MKEILRRILAFSRFLNVVGGTALVFIVLLTTADVILRSFRRPILGTYEIVAFIGSIVILFSLPFTSWTRSHIFVDFFILKLPQRARNLFHAVTRILVFCLFILFGWNMFKYGMDLRGYGEVSSTLRIPFYPLVYALAICCFIQCLVLLADLVKIYRGEYE